MVCLGLEPEEVLVKEMEILECEFSNFLVIWKIPNPLTYTELFRYYVQNTEELTK